MTTVAAPEPLGAEPLGAGPPARTVDVVEARIPTEVSAAWELELLIAGMVTFALFQLPGSLESVRGALLARVSGGAEYAVILGYIYAKVIVYILIAAFLLNLVLRAYWVGLVGLHSVFPRGVVWEQMRLGPASVEEYRKRLASLPSVIGKIDNFASVIFSFAFLVVVMCLFSLVASAVFGGMAWGINQLLFHGKHGIAAFEILCFGFALPLALVGLIDKKLGPRWAPDSDAGRRLRAAVRVASRVNGTVLFGPIFFTLFTNLKRGVMITLFYVAFLGAMLLAIAEFFVRIGLVAGGSPTYVPDDDSVRGVDASHYESMLTPEPMSNAPTIQSDVIDGPYVKLFVPYVAERHDPALATSCPGAAPLRAAHIHLVTHASSDRPTTDSAAAAILGCLARMHAVTIDGAPVSDLQFRFYTHPVTGRRGMIAYVPTASLAPGAHTLGVMPPPRAPDSQSRTPLRPTEIPFWK